MIYRTLIAILFCVLPAECPTLPPIPGPQVKYASSFAYSIPKTQAIAETVNNCYVAITGQPVTVTSFADGRHKKDSLHYQYRAVDFRVATVPSEKREQVRDCAEGMLGESFRVLLKMDHLHAELREP